MSGVDVTIVLGATHHTHPFSYSEVLGSVGARLGPAISTGSGRSDFIDNLEPHLVPNGFIRKLGSELRPPGVVNRLVESALGQGGGAHVADEDCTILFY